MPPSQREDFPRRPRPLPKCAYRLRRRAEKLFARVRDAFLARVRLPLLQRKTENAWLESDRRERLKLLAATLALVVAGVAGIGLLVYGLLHA